jgi:hypothetical protein
VILSAPFAQQAFVEVSARWPARTRAVAIGATAVPAAVALLAALWRIRDRRPLRYGLVALGFGVGAAHIRITGLTFTESFHFVEYGVLAVLFYRVWNSSTDGSMIVLPLLAATIVGTLDEWFQWFIPIRAGEARDIVLNNVAAGCGLLLAIGMHPPARFTPGLHRPSRLRVLRGAAVAMVLFGLFFRTVHVGYDVGDPEIGSFQSRYTGPELASTARDRAERWRSEPPVFQRLLWREDQYLTEGLWHVQQRNQAWAARDLATAWRENRILEKFYPPILETPTYADARGHRWPAAQREAAAAQAGADVGRSASDAYRYPLYVWPSFSSMLLGLKLLLVPGLVAAVTLAVRTWGPGIGGWLAGLPVVAGPVLVFYAIEQGTVFAGQAAHATLAGLMATVAFGVAYARCSVRLKWYGCVLVGWTAFAAATFILYALQPALVVSLICLVAATIAGRRALPRVEPSGTPVVNPRGDLAIRLLATAILVLVLTGLAERLGPTLSGLLNAFPVLTTIMAAFTHAQRGGDAAVAFVNGYLRGIVGFALFCFVLALTIDRLGLPPALTAALGAQFVVSGFILRTSRAASEA